MADLPDRRTKKGSQREDATAEGWSTPLPEKIPRATYWPVVMALGTIFIVWGAVTTVIISGIGGGLFVLALSGWIGELRRES